MSNLVVVTDNPTMTPFGLLCKKNHSKAKVVREQLIDNNNENHVLYHTPRSNGDVVFELHKRWRFHV